MKRYLSGLILISVLLPAQAEPPAAPEAKPASKHTITRNREHAQRLNFEDRDAFTRTQKGLIAEFDTDTARIMYEDYKFIGAETPDTVNPSLYRQAQLNQEAKGLYKVTEGIYQVRGTDLSNLTLIRGKTGWILYDVLLTREAAAQSLKFALANLPEGRDLPVSAMIYSHSHADHFGGARAIVELYPNIPIYGPVNLGKEIVDENILAGNAMSRRSAYQYGATLGINHTGIVDAAIGKGISKGAIGYVQPTVTVNENSPLERLEIDGIEMFFLDVPGAEAPAEMVTYIPHVKALWTAELTHHGMHNIYTLRGAKIRDALAWSKYLNQMLKLWGGDAEVLLASHSSPIWGNSEIKNFLRLQRDNYGLVHNQTLRLANNGVVIQDIGDAVAAAVPESIYKSWHTNGYHGTYSHNAKGIYNLYLGYFDMNPANLNPLTTVLEAEKFVEYMGGARRVYKRAKKDFKKGQYRFVATVLNKVLVAQPSHDPSRQLLADTYEQLGYQAESAGWRNTYLTGAQELRAGLQVGAQKTASQDMLSALSMSSIFDFLAVRVDSLKAATHGLVTINVVDKDSGEILYVELSNGNLNNIVVDKLANSDATLTIRRADLFQILNRKQKLADLIANKQVTLGGDVSAFGKIAASLVSFDTQFSIVPLPVK